MSALMNIIFKQCFKSNLLPHISFRNYNNIYSKAKVTFTLMHFPFKSVIKEKMIPVHTNIFKTHYILTKEYIHTKCKTFDRSLVASTQL